MLDVIYGYESWYGFFISLPYRLMEAALITLWFYALYVAIFDNRSDDDR